MIMDIVNGLDDFEQDMQDYKEPTDMMLESWINNRAYYVNERIIMQLKLARHSQ